MGGREEEKKWLLFVVRPEAFASTEEPGVPEVQLPGNLPKFRGCSSLLFTGSSPSFYRSSIFCSYKFIRKYIFSREGIKATTKGQIKAQIHGVGKRRKSGSSVALSKAINPRAAEPWYQKQK